MRHAPVPTPSSAGRPARSHVARVRSACVLAVLLLGAGAAGRPAGPRARPEARAQTPRDEIAAMMTRSAEAWNRGDLDAFVADYVPGEGMTYIGSRGIVRGPAAIRAAYAPRFAPGVRRGTLRFEDLEVDVLAPGVANVIAYYVLSEKSAAGADSTVARGPTSLVMRRGPGARWRILHDHSS